MKAMMPGKYPFHGAMCLMILGIFFLLRIIVTTGFFLLNSHRPRPPALTLLLSFKNSIVWRFGYRLEVVIIS